MISKDKIRRQCDIDWARFIPWCDDIEDGHLAKVMEAIGSFMKEDPKKPIYLWINSRGGNYSDGLGFYDFVKSNKIPLHTHGFGEIVSAALPVYFSGIERSLSEHCFVYFHPSSLKLEESTHNDEVRLESLQIELFDKIEEKIISSRSRAKRATVREFMSKRKLMNAYDAVEWGLAHYMVKS